MDRVDGGDGRQHLQYGMAGDIAAMEYAVNAGEGCKQRRGKRVPIVADVGVGKDADARHDQWPCTMISGLPPIT